MNGLMARGILYQCLRIEEQSERFKIDRLTSQGDGFDVFDNSVNTVVLTAKDVETCLDDDDQEFDGLISDIKDIMSNHNLDAFRKQNIKRIKIYGDDYLSMYIVFTTELGFGRYDFKSLQIYRNSVKIYQD